MSPQSVKVLVADDHPAVCAGVRHALIQSPNINVSCAPRSAGGMQQALEAAAYDVLVCEYAMLGGLSAGSAPCLEVIRQRYPGLRIVILTRLENAGVVHMLLSRGVHCIVSKVDELSHLLPAIRARAATGAICRRASRRWRRPRVMAGRACWR
ncbi:response regulator [Achromobacter xylosoxidans]